MPDDIEVLAFDLVDASRDTPAVGRFPGAHGRNLPTTMYLPSVAEPAPLIVLAHGLNGHPRKFTGLARHWAEAGFAVAVPQFPVSSDEFADCDPVVLDRRLADVVGQAGDIAFVVGAVLAGTAGAAADVAERIDPGRVGLYGLSLGSLTVWSTLLGSHVASVAAVMQSDGAFPGGDEQLTGVAIPVFVAHSDIDPIFPAAGVVRQFEALAGPKFLLVLHGAAHAAVGENTPTAADDAYRMATTVFWDRYLGGMQSTAFPSSIVVDGVTSFVDVS